MIVCEKNSSKELLTGAKKAQSLQSGIGMEGLESSYPDHEKHVHKTKEGSYGKTGTYTLPMEQFLREFGVAEEKTLLN